MSQFPAYRRRLAFQRQYGLSNISLPMWSLIEANRQLRRIMALPWFGYTSRGVE